MKIKHKLIALSLFALASKSFACKDNFEFAQDKQKHLAANVLMASSVTGLTQDPWKGFIFATSVSVVKELHDFKSGCPSWHDMAYNLIGAGVGTYLGSNLFISPNKVVYFKEF